MREILFRGKRKDNGEWVEGGIYHNSEDEIVFIIKDTGLGYHEFIEVIPETVGQFTGLYDNDKNGTKIFEGDIVKGKDYLEEGLEVYGCIDHRNGSFVIVGDFITYYRWLDYEVEVIGNIHDNPELLEGETE
jgi:uncharacterized phage protein (TIGR01671 family)